MASLSVCRLPVSPFGSGPFQWLSGHSHAVTKRMMSVYPILVGQHLQSQWGWPWLRGWASARRAESLSFILASPVGMYFSFILASPVGNVTDLSLRPWRAMPVWINNADFDGQVVWFSRGSFICFHIWAPPWQTFSILNSHAETRHAVNFSMNLITRQLLCLNSLDGMQGKLRTESSSQVQCWVKQPSACTVSVHAAGSGHFCL